MARNVPEVLVKMHAALALDELMGTSTHEVYDDLGEDPANMFAVSSHYLDRVKIGFAVSIVSGLFRLF